MTIFEPYVAVKQYADPRLCEKIAHQLVDHFAALSGAASIAARLPVRQELMMRYGFNSSELAGKPK